MKQRILVVTSCTGEKVNKPANQLILDDFRDPKRLSRRENELSQYRITAGVMYTGRQHAALMRGMEKYRKNSGVIDVDVAILSAGYGLLSENDWIVPYEVTYNSMGKTQIKAWANRRGVTENMQARIKQYDLIFFLLGDKYLQAIEWPLDVEEQRLIFFAGKMSQRTIEAQPNASMILIGEEEASRFHSGLIEIKGFMFEQLLQYASEHPDAWQQIYEDPSNARKFILSTLERPGQLELFQENDTEPEHIFLEYVDHVLPFFVSDESAAANYLSELNYFMPENDDRVDPRFDFEHDEHTEHRNPLTDDRYAHEFYPAPNYDGILISKVNIDKATINKKRLIQEHGIRRFLRLPETARIMGDCGAFSYISKDVPPYTTVEVLDYYQTLGFDYGVSVDHLIVGNIEKDEEERKRRYDITLNNAEKFITEHRQAGYEFTPVGVAQGWDPASFRDAVQNLIAMGYEYIALGGLAKEKSIKILEILKEIAPQIPDRNFRMHLFGVARDMEVMKAFHKLGVTSFDSASPLRRAWLDSRHNYYSHSGKTYTAIRIPEANQGKGRFKEIEDTAEFETIKALELRALELVRSYGANGAYDLEPTLEAILAYDQHIGGNRKHHPLAYRDLLVDKPWKTCGCPICEQVGIDVVIFRGNNRNRRRGFHNTHVYYQQLLKLKNELFGPPSN